MAVVLRAFASVFPTPVGMNRVITAPGDYRKCVPHARGDEPLVQHILQLNPDVFPTPVGMNR